MADARNATQRDTILRVSTLLVLHEDFKRNRVLEIGRPYKLRIHVSTFGADPRMARDKLEAGGATAVYEST